MKLTTKQKQILIDKKSFAQIGIIRKKSNKPHVSPVWFDMSEEDIENGFINFNSATGRLKPKNLFLGSEVYFSITDPDNFYDYVGIEGQISEIITGEEAEKHIDELAFKYLNKESYPYRNDKEKRIKYKVKITNIIPM
jgi:hypothetical protein